MNKVVDELSKEHRNRFLAHLQNWHALELSTEPANRGRAEKFIQKAYSLAGLLPPAIHWCASPFEMALCRAMVAVLSSPLKLNCGNIGRESFSDTVSGIPVKAKIRNEPILKASEIIDSVVTSNFKYQIWTSMGAGLDFTPLFNSDMVPAPVYATSFLSQNTWITECIVNAIRLNGQSNVKSPESVWDGAWRIAESIIGPVDKMVRLNFKRDAEENYKWMTREIFEIWGSCGFGQHDARFLALPSFLRTNYDLVEETDPLQALIGLVDCCGWYAPHERACWVCERPVSILLDNAGRPHNEFGPAIAFADGWKVYAWHGVIVEERVIERSHELTAEDIDQERNVELRRILIERFGVERYLMTEMYVLDDNPDYGTLYMKWVAGDEPIVMIKVINSTPEPDGTKKEYFIRVPPEITRAREAVAWTFRMEPGAYKPQLET